MTIWTRLQALAAQQWTREAKAAVRSTGRPTRWTTLCALAAQSLVLGAACGRDGSAGSETSPDVGPALAADANAGAGGANAGRDTSPFPDATSPRDAVADGPPEPDLRVDLDSAADALPRTDATSSDADADALPDSGASGDAFSPPAPDSRPDMMAADVGPVDGPPEPPEDPAVVSRILPWLGGGLQIIVELPDNRHHPELAPEVWLETPLEPHLPAAVANAQVTTGITAILLVPAEDAGEHLMRLVVANAVIDALAEGERIALLVARDEAVLVAELSLDRAHAHAQLARLRPEGGRSAAPLMDDLRSRIDDLESNSTSPGRSLVVIGEQVDERPPRALRPVQTLSVGAIVDPGADAAALAAGVYARRASLVRVGACPGLADEEPFVLHVGETALLLEAPRPIAHLGAEACDATQAADDAYPFPTEVDLTFTAEERAVYDTAYAAASIDPFPMSVTLGLGLTIPAVGHFHGMGTLGCERKSFAIELDGPRRRLMPDLAGDRFILISMCQDLRYFGQVFGNRLLAGLGLFPSPFRYVKLRIDGRNAGVYMMVYQPERAFRDTSLGLASVIRRGYDIDAWPAEVKFPSDPIEAAAAQLRFEAIGDLALSEPPESLEAALDARVEFDSYLRLLAAFSLLENGDFIDEAFFASSLEGDVERYRVMAWDTDDLWSACHADGARAIVDPCGVTYCTEAELDQSLLRSPAVYRRYLDALATVMAWMSPARLERTMLDVQTELWRVLDDDETAAACTEMVYENPATATLDGAQADIATFMEGALAQIERRREVLAAALSVCPDAVP